MKVLLVHPGPAFSVSDVHDGLLAGLIANGVDARSLNLHDRLDFYAAAAIRKGNRYIKAMDRESAIRAANQGLLAMCYQWWPDVIIVMSGFFINPDTWATLARRPHHTILWCTESPYEDDRQARPARYVDTVVINDPLNLEALRAVNPRTYYFPHSYNPDIHHPGPADPELECDFAFVGTAFPSRIEFFEKVDFDGLTVRLGGNWAPVTDDSPLLPYLMAERGQCIDNHDAARLYRSATVGANLYRREHTDTGVSTDAGVAMGPREVELAACGSFFAREPRPEGDQLFPMLPTFTEPGELGDLIRWALTNPDARRDAAVAAQAAIADRTFTNTAARLLRLVDGVGKPNIA